MAADSGARQHHPPPLAELPAPQAEALARWIVRASRAIPPDRLATLAEAATRLPRRRHRVAEAPSTDD
jgi:hypothetical protein